MENQNQHSETTDYSEEIKRWAEEDVLQLANHFHRLTKGQFERTSYFTMTAPDVAIFQELKPLITDLRIYMAIEAQNKEKHTFFPVLRVTNDKEEHTFLKLIAPEVRKQNSTKSEVVPEVFKNMISKNWDEVDFHLIDDLFTARKKEELNRVVVESTVRVLYFQISTDIINHVIKELTEIKGITLYSGIDMNKFSDKYQISFTPVLGFQHGNIDAGDFTFGLKSIVEFSKGEVFIEYSRPCPPTC
ncbi:hypothetical protein IMCC3317_37180 [Kordia antarctica]|uniref:Uncharacterized protein n=1 Tax=Kordia antarctica TaxID=1218801 RepID=A0A7L4ZPB8_9FLAO|nr:hypothetical protein [Kordia antarctica]QHI38327.1 hypothetical protein IMCC3317_37180 [Kordia antarctica]